MAEAEYISTECVSCLRSTQITGRRSCLQPTHN